MSASDDELVGDLRSAGDPERVARSARGLVTQADELLDQGSADEALEVLDTVIDALDGSADMEPRKVLALALAWVLLTEAMILEHQNRKGDAGATLKALLKRFDGDSSPAITEMLDAARHALEMYRKNRWQPPW